MDPSNNDDGGIVEEDDGNSEGESYWDALDLSGVRLRALSVNICHYKHLTQLYLNNNALENFPAVVCLHLSNLRDLDLSFNLLTALPQEVGELTHLENLLFYSNRITALPVEMGRLWRIKEIGHGGNPLIYPPADVLPGGTEAVFAYLRDSMPPPPVPLPRKWIPVDNTATSRNGGIKVISYNVLNEAYATHQMYPYCPSWALDWKHRKNQVLRQVLAHDADIICLQEVAVQEFSEFFKTELARADYAGVFKPKSRANTMSEKERRTVDGCAIFYRRSRFSFEKDYGIEFSNVAMGRPDMREDVEGFNRVMTRDNIAVAVKLKALPNPGFLTEAAHLYVVNSHIHWDPRFADVKLVQTQILLEEMERITNRDPVIFCADLNSTTESAVYELLEKSSVPPNHQDLQFGFKYGRYSTKGFHHNLALQSAYKHLGEPMTNYTGDFKGVLDYIWFSGKRFKLAEVMEPVNPESLKVYPGLPYAHHPSDHLMLGCTLLPKKPSAHGGK